MVTVKNPKRQRWLSATGTHNNKEFRVVMTPSPGVKTVRGKTVWTTPTPFVRFNGAVKSERIVSAVLCPATFIVKGLPRVVTFTTVVGSQGGVTIGKMTIAAGSKRGQTLEDDAIPKPSQLLRAAFKASSCAIWVTPNDGINGGKVVGIGGLSTRDDLLISYGQKPQPSREPMLDDRVLRAVAKLHKKGMALKRSERGELRQWIRDQGHPYEPGTIAVQITAAKLAGYIDSKTTNKRGAK